MWKKNEVDPSTAYTIELCQDDGARRSIRLRAEAGSRSADAIHVTERVPHELLLRRDLYEIEQRVRLLTGEGFVFDAHGVWFTASEFEAWENDEDIPWSTKTPPVIAPK